MVGSQAATDTCEIPGSSGPHVSSRLTSQDRSTAGDERTYRTYRKTAWPGGTGDVDGWTTASLEGTDARAHETRADVAETIRMAVDDAEGWMEQYDGFIRSETIQFDSLPSNLENCSRFTRSKSSSPASSTAFTSGM